MYSNKENVNILTKLLMEHGVRHAVVCPGSRNAPIVHNLSECGKIRCSPVTDERSAGFYALGISQMTGERVAVCVTSGTALLNLAPAVAEAYYQHKPIVVVSADRPAQWIDQLDGQTLPQVGALGTFVAKSVSLPEPSDEEQRWWCNRLVNEALAVENSPVHINVPISEPLFDFSCEELPAQRKIEVTTADISGITLAHIGRMFMLSKRPMLIAGQPLNKHLDEAAYLVGGNPDYVPDFVLYTGGSLVSKRAKAFLRKSAETWAVNTTGEVNDTFMNLTHVIQGDSEVVADHIRFLLEDGKHPFFQKWQGLLSAIEEHAERYSPSYSQLAAVKSLENLIEGDSIVHYANSSAIRLANIYARHRVFCNRGVNGIEGSLSTAAGASLVSEEPVFCVIGDLSFFYDQNALWSQSLRESGKLRILLLNNGTGGIFHQLKGLEKSPVRDSLIAASHSTTAEGVCMQNGVGYRRAANEAEMLEGLRWLVSSPCNSTILLEVVTTSGQDVNVLRDYYNSLAKIEIF